jgi:multiple sugar transport system substrate-binding protein
VGGAAPDIYNIYSIWAPQLAAAGVLEPLPPEIVALVEENYSPATVAAADQVDGELRGIPTELSIYALIYNKELLRRRASTRPPRPGPSCARRRRPSRRPTTRATSTWAATPTAPAWPRPSTSSTRQMYAAGVAPFAEDGRSTNLASPEAVRILEDQAALFADGITSNAIVVENFSGRGAVGMQIGANWNRAEYAEAFGEDRLDEVVGVAPIPHGRAGGTMLYTFFWPSTPPPTPSPRPGTSSPSSAPRATARRPAPGAAMPAWGALTGNTADLAAMGDMVSEPFTRVGASWPRSRRARAQTQPNVWQAAEASGAARPRAV